MKWAEPAPESVSFCTSYAAWKKAGLTFHDVDEVFMGFPDHVVAYQNGAIDASNTSEPAATRAVEIGAAVRFWTNDQFYPNQQIATVLYSKPFAGKKEVATRFMVGYLRAVRLYNDALKDGHYAGPAADEVIGILARRTAVKDPAIYKKLTPNGCNPNGRLNVASLKRDLEAFKAAGFVKSNVQVEQTLDTSSVEAALKILGPYKPRTA
jgi:NitT/TauT family transport system substrate-binding protein